MSFLRKKICMIGDFGVGKTSLVSRFVHNSFSEKYHTTLGVKIDTKMVHPPGERPVKLVIWDIAGKDRLASLDGQYLRGASGCILVVDGTRTYTLESAENLRNELQAALGPIPLVTFLNKSDLQTNWELEDGDMERLREEGWNPVETSAKTGAGVETGFLMLGSLLVGGP